MNNLTLNYIKTTNNNPIEKGYHWVESWLFSTNAKQIGILYGIFSLFSGLVGLSLSILMRIELASPNPQILMHNGQLWNVLITAHAIFMVFFLVMPITMGAFANIKNNNDINKFNKMYNYSNNNKYNFITDKKELGSYLAGLIEGDGTITVHNNISKNRYSPMISIVFTSQDKPIIEYLITNIIYLYNLNSKEFGIIQDKSKHGNYIIWQINKIEEVYILISLINGYFRTPKIIKLYEAINWINLYIINYHDNIKNLDETYGFNKINKLKIMKIINNIDFIDIKSIDDSSLDTNNWLSGFTDADGYFAININNRKNRNPSVNLSFRIKIQQNWSSFIKNNKNHEINDNIVNLKIINRNKIYEYKNINLSYHNNMVKIAEFFNSNVFSRKTNKKLGNSSEFKIYYSYEVAVSRLDNQLLVQKYFNNHKLLSSKFNNFNDWSKVLNCIYSYNSRINEDCIKLSRQIILNYNNTRKTFYWDHLFNIINK